MYKEHKDRLIQALKTGDLAVIQACSNHTLWLSQPLEDIRLPIHIAAQYGHTDVVAFLVKTDPTQLNIRDEFDQTPVIWAAANGRAETLQLLVSLSADLECATSRLGSPHHNWTPLKWAMMKDHKHCVAILQEAHYQAVYKAIIENPSLLTMPDGKGETLLFKSTRLGHLDAVKYLIAQGADMDARYSDMQYHVLHIAAKNGHLALVKCFLEEMNLHDLDQKDFNGQTAILWAAARGHLDIVQYLAKKGANLLLPSNEGKTPIDWAIAHNHHDIVSFLILMLSGSQSIETLYPYIRDARVAIKLMEYDASLVPRLLDDTRVYELIHTSPLCETTERLIASYEPATVRSPSRYRRIDKKTGQSVFFAPIEAPLGQGTYGTVRRLVNIHGETLAVKSNHIDYAQRDVEDELKFMQKAYPVSNSYHLFSFTRTIGSKTTHHYRYIMPDFPGECFDRWAKKETSADQLAQVVVHIVEELYRLHGMQIIHGDLIPANILVSMVGNEYVIYFVDFGRAYASNGRVRECHSTDKRYPPECQHASTKASPRQDIYTLATTFKNVLFKHPSYDALKLRYPSIYTFIIHSCDERPENRPSLKIFCDTLKKELHELGMVAPRCG